MVVVRWSKTVRDYGVGVKPQERKAGYKVFQQLKTKETKDMVYLEPIIRCQIKHRGYYKSGMLRLLCLNGSLFRRWSIWLDQLSVRSARNMEIERT